MGLLKARLYEIEKCIDLNDHLLIENDVKYGPLPPTFEVSDPQCHIQCIQDHIALTLCLYNLQALQKERPKKNLHS